MDARKANSASGVARKHETRKDEHVLDAWRDQVEWAWGGREAGWVLDRAPAIAYAKFLDFTFFHYGENTRAAERGTREG
jgi:hypothetical protein